MTNATVAAENLGEEAEEIAAVAAVSARRVSASRRDLRRVSARQVGLTWMFLRTPPGQVSLCRHDGL